MSGAIDLAQATAFVWMEADLLDARDYDTWLSLWTTGGLYVIPIDQDAEDFASVLNYQYDDAAMRLARVMRLRSTTSMSVTAAAHTVRTISRFRILENDSEKLTIRSAQHLVEHKRDAQRLYAANVTYRLIRQDNEIKLDQKVIRLINSTDALGGIAYLM